MSQINPLNLLGNCKNNDINHKKAEDTNAFKDKNLIKQLSEEDQNYFLSKYIGDFQGFKANQSEDNVYFDKTNGDSTDFYRVVNDNGETKIIHTTISPDSSEAKTEILGLNKTDELTDWNSQRNLDKILNENKTIDDFKMFEFNPETYTKDIKQFAQDYINKYDSNNDGELNFNEFMNLSVDSTEIDINTPGLKEFNEKIFADYQMDKNSGTISSSELASQFIMSDIDWKSSATDIGDLVDGKLNFVSYNTIAASPENTEVYNNDLEIRKDIFNQYYSNKTEE